MDGIILYICIGLDWIRQFIYSGKPMAIYYTRYLVCRVPVSPLSTQRSVSQAGIHKYREFTLTFMRCHQSIQYRQQLLPIHT